MSQYLIDQIADKTNIRIEPWTQVDSVLVENYIQQIAYVSYRGAFDRQP